MRFAVVAAVDALAVDALRTYGNGYRDLVRLLKAEDVEEKFLSCRIIRAEPGTHTRIRTQQGFASVEISSFFCP
jgi:hypothetical protein